MKRRAKLLIMYAALFAGQSCLTDLDASYVEIQRAVAPTTTCQFAIGNNPQAYGVYDPALDYLSNGPAGYSLSLVVRNNLELSSSDTLTFGPLANARDQATNVEIVGLEGCWYQYAGDVQQLGNYQNGELVDCTSIPAQAGSIPVGQEIDANLGQQVIGVLVLTPDVLRTIFGTGFNIAAVINNSANWSYNPNNLTVGSSIFPGQLAAPGNSNTRDPNWGANYPTTLNAPIVVQLRAVYTDQGGRTGHSNWFPYVINYCPTCLIDPCGPSSVIKCPQATCANASACGSGANTANGDLTCSDGTQCSGIIALNGPLVTYIAACLPSQGDAGTAITCTPTNQCPTTVP